MQETKAEFFSRSIDLLIGWRLNSFPYCITRENYSVSLVISNDTGRSIFSARSLLENSTTAQKVLPLDFFYRKSYEGVLHSFHDIHWINVKSVVTYSASVSTI